MSKFWSFFTQIYLQKIKSTSFVLLTFVYIIIASGIIFWSDIKEFISDNFADEVAVINNTNVEFEDSAFVSDSSINFSFLENDKKIEKDLKDEKYDAVVELNDVDDKLVATIISNESLKLSLQTKLETLINTVATSFVMDKLEPSSYQLNILNNSEPIINNKTLDSDAKSSDEKSIGQTIAYFSGFLIFVFVTNFLSMIVVNIASEKGSRNLEMLLVNVRPETHFKAKLLGVFALAITQFIVLISLLLILITFIKDGHYLNIFMDVISEVSVSYFVFTLVFLVVSLVMFLIVGGLFGSLVSKVDEANQVSGPAVMLIVASFYVMLSGLANPDTILIKVFSYLPFSSGMVMPMRMGATDISSSEIWLSLGILFTTTIVLYFFAISFYKRSVLTYSTGGVIEKIKSVFKYTS